MKERIDFAVIPGIHLGRIMRNWNDRIRGIKEAVKGVGIEERLLRTVNLINLTPEIEFVVTVGDLTDTGLPGQFLRVKEILDGLRVPWVPMLGNHDVWPYDLNWKYLVFPTQRGWEAEGPEGLEYFESIFKENFKDLISFFQDWEKQERSEALLKNFAFTFKSTRFIGVDNVNRRHALFGFPGVVPWSRLYPESKDWLQEQLSRKGERKIIFSHSPLKKGLLNSLSREAQIVNIAGHVHKERYLRKSNITTFVTGALYLKPMINVVKVLPDEIQFHSVRIP